MYLHGEEFLHFSILKFDKTRLIFCPERSARQYSKYTVKYFNLKFKRVSHFVCESAIRAYGKTTGEKKWSKPLLERNYSYVISV